MLDTWTATALNISNYLVEYYYEGGGGSGIGSLSLALEPFKTTYNYWMSFADRRVESWPLMSQPWTTMAITTAYLAMCLLGPRAMAAHKPVEGLRPVIVAYNLLVAGLNLYIGLELLATSRMLKFSWLCEPVNYSGCYFLIAHLFITASKYAHMRYVSFLSWLF